MPSRLIYIPIFNLCLGTPVWSVLQVLKPFDPDIDLSDDANWPPRRSPNPMCPWRAEEREKIEPSHHNPFLVEATDRGGLLFYDSSFFLWICGWECTGDYAIWRHHPLLESTSSSILSLIFILVCPSLTILGAKEDSMGEICK